MSLEIQEISMDESQMLAPEKINNNFKKVKAIIDKIEAKPVTHAADLLQKGILVHTETTFFDTCSS